MIGVTKMNQKASTNLLLANALLLGNQIDL